MENTLVRSQPCTECGAEVLWTQNAWKSGDTGSAAYQCVNGHLIDPAQTRQCPKCGVHDTVRLDDADGVEHFQCTRCATGFTFPTERAEGEIATGLTEVIAGDVRDTTHI